MRPPSSPAPGPVSITSSAARITVGSCSTTTTVFPACCSSRITVITRAVSAGCRPCVGSSSTYSVPVSPELSAATSRVRRASPPDSDFMLRSSVRYSRPQRHSRSRRRRACRNAGVMAWRSELESSCSAVCSQFIRAPASRRQTSGRVAPRYRAAAGNAASRVPLQPAHCCMEDSSPAVPVPPQSGHAPSGELKLKCWGVMSLNSVPQPAHSRRNG